MKNFKSFRSKILAIATLFFFTLTISSCESCQKPPASDNDDIVEQDSITTPEITDADIAKLLKTHIIKPEKAVNMYTKYTHERINPLREQLIKMYNKPDFKDTRNVWFDIKTIQAYLEYLKREAGDFDGLQFYFSVNVDGNEDKDHQTFFIAPTKKSANGVQSGFTIIKGKTKFFYELLEENTPQTQKAGLLNLVQEDKDLFFNRGNNSPPGSGE